ncbi:MAG: phosphate ABC transporter permease PstA [Actinomycetaceae bacterium]|nr:phosphate ABC transporter permease PstA [Actinomycetaceae bacterium]MDY6082262.1 phosphate ABC transporter permease PstA [Actinomycetaceae bacterium]
MENLESVGRSHANALSISPSGEREGYRPPSAADEPSGARAGHVKISSDVMMSRIRRAKRMDTVMTWLFSGVGLFFLLLIVVLAGYIIINGLRSYTPGMLSFTSKGIGNQIFNTVYLVFLSLIVSVGLGLPAGIYMAEYAPENKITAFIRVCIEALSSLPSIVVGLFGYVAFILLTGMQYNLMAGALAVSILNLPLVTTETEAAIRSLPRSMSDGSAALGATHWHTIMRVLLPAGLPHVMTGVMLAAQRAFGEAAALLYTAGQGVALNWGNWADVTSPVSPLNPFRSGETLAVHIWAMRTQGGMPGIDTTGIANFTAAILVLIALLFTVGVNYSTKKVHARATGMADKKKAKK